MSKTPQEVLNDLSRKRAQWLESTRENNFEEGLKGLLSELYPDQAHFIYELLQNAEDAKATQVRFELTKSGLVFSHNGGKLFNHKDVESITGIGDSTKKNDVNSIGKFGIGFKAVFAYSNTPQVHSGDYSFQITHLFCPSEIEPISLSQKQTIFIFPFDNPDKPASQCYQEILKVFESMDHTAVLFLNNIQSIEWKIDDQAPGFVMRDDLTSIDKALCQISITNPKAVHLEEDIWFLKYQDTMEGHGNLLCGIAFQLGFRRSSQKGISRSNAIHEQFKVVQADGKLCIFFPAEKEATGLKFYINGPFASAIDRASVKHDHKDNKLIMKTIAELLVSSVFNLKYVGLLNSDFLAVLPNDEDLLSPFYDVVRRRIYLSLKSDELIPTKDGDFAPANCLVRGPKTLSDTFSGEDVSFLSYGAQRVWAAGVLQNSRADKLLNSLDVPAWNNSALIESLKKKFSRYVFNDEAADWLLNKPSTWWAKFYLVVSTAVKREDCESQVSGWRICVTNESDLACGSEIFFPATGGRRAGDRVILHRSVFKGVEKEERARLKTFFDLVGVSQLGEREEIENILDFFYTQDGDAVTKKDHSEHIARFIQYYQKHKDNRLFDDYYIFMGKGDEFFLGEFCYLDRPFRETGLRAIYEGVKDEDGTRYPLWPGYKKIKGFREFAIACNVQDSLQVKKTRAYGNPAWKKMAEGTLGSKETITGVNSDYAIEGLVKLLKRKDPKVALLVWNAARKADPAVLEAQYRPNQRYDIRYAPSKLVCELSSFPWIPAKDKKFYKPQEVTKSHLMAGFQFDDRNGWLTAIGFADYEKKASQQYKDQKVLVESLGVSLSDIDLIKELKAVPEEYQKFKRRVAALSAPTEFPSRDVKNVDRRKEKVAASISDSEETSFQGRERSVRVSSSAIDADSWLRQQYVNGNHELVCQMCHEVMPFKKKNDEYYMEAVEIASGFKVEREELRLALCPVCSAKYKEFVKNDEKNRRKFLENLYLSNAPEISVDLGKEKAKIKFVGSHFHDLKALLEDQGLPGD